MRLWEFLRGGQFRGQRPSDVSCRSLCSHTVVGSDGNGLTEAEGVEGVADGCRLQLWFWALRFTLATMAVSEELNPG